MRHLAANPNGQNVLWGDLDVLDRRIVDSDGEFVGAVDDADLQTMPDGTLTLAALLVGRGALTRRVSRRFGRWVESLHARLHPEQPLGPVRIPLSYVRQLDPAVELSVPGRELDLTLYDELLADHIVDHIPGAGHASQ